MAWVISKEDKMTFEALHSLLKKERNRPAPPFLCNLYSCRRRRSLRPSCRPNRPRHGVITITGIGDHLRPEWPITITGTRTQSADSFPAAATRVHDVAIYSVAS